MPNGQRNQFGDDNGYRDRMNCNGRFGDSMMAQLAVDFPNGTALIREPP